MTQALNVALNDHKSMPNLAVRGVNAQQSNEKLEAASDARVAESLKQLSAAMAPVQAASKTTQELHSLFSKTRQDLEQQDLVKAKSAASTGDFSALNVGEDMLPSYSDVITSPPVYQEAINAKDTQHNLSLSSAVDQPKYTNTRIAGENIFGRIQRVFENLRNLVQMQLSALVDDLERSTSIARNITDLSNYLHTKWMEMVAAGPEKKFEWSEGSEKGEKDRMENLFAFMRENNIKVNNQSIDDWLKQKPEGGVDKVGEMTQPELVMLKETLKNEAQKKTDFNAQLQTKVTAFTQTFSNYQEGLTNMITTTYKTLRSIIEALRV